LPLIYDELRELARAKLAQEKPGQTLQATALVHEAYLKLMGSTNSSWNSRGHFFGAAAEAIRRILIDQARKRQTQKHGKDFGRVELDDQIEAPMRDEKLIRLDEALETLESEDPQKAQLVKLRYFAGLTIRESAKVLDISTSTADRYWTYARAWIQREMASMESE
jgi:RNA polymerase sigma factor (TIGR02999 family)